VYTEKNIVLEAHLFRCPGEGVGRHVVRDIKGLPITGKACFIMDIVQYYLSFVREVEFCMTKGLHCPSSNKSGELCPSFGINVLQVCL